MPTVLSSSAFVRTDISARDVNTSMRAFLCISLADAMRSARDSRTGSTYVCVVPHAIMVDTVNTKTLAIGYG